MKPAELRLCRSLLFLPASNRRAIEKARDLPADMIFLDCEDAVKPEEKDAARAAAVAAAAEGFGGRPVAIRMNGRATPWYGDDLVALRASRADYVILPKVEDAHLVHDAAGILGRPVLAMIETAGGVVAAPAIARQAAGLIAGTNDLRADLGLPAGGDRSGLVYALQAIVIAARSAGIAAFDGVYNGLEDPAALARECEEGRAYGYDGKTLIHPGQIEVANRRFGPSEAELDAAARLVAAATGGAERFEGRMIEDMHVAQARAMLEKGRR